MPIRYKDLIETNIRQRVLGNTNPVKLGRCFSFLNKWYGFEHGGNHGNQYTVASGQVFHLISSDEPHNQTELVNTYGITKQTIIHFERTDFCVLVLLIPKLLQFILSLN